MWLEYLLSREYFEYTRHDVPSLLKTVSNTSNAGAILRYLQQDSPEGGFGKIIDILDRGRHIREIAKSNRETRK